MFTKLRNWFLCRLSHDWTCAHDEGIPPTKEQLQNIPDGFWDYAKMYCKRCNKVYKP